MNNYTNTKPTQISEYIFKSTIKILLSSIFKFGAMAQIPPQNLHFSVTPFIAHSR